MTQPTGVLLINLGTPDEPETAAVRRYLREFLSDPRVIDMNPVGRWLLLNLIILPTRPAKSAAAYRKIWGPAGSPLLTHGRALAEAVGDALQPDDAIVTLAMRYGNPSIAAGLDTLRQAGCDRLIVFPLYPQYASSSTGSTVEAVYREASKRWNTPYITVIPPFFGDARFLNAFASVGKPILNDLQPEHVVFSFHGLPERHIRKSDEGHGCLENDHCCDELTLGNRNCYRAQCWATARGIARALALSPHQYTMSFQSRLGRDPWIRPYTDETIVNLAKSGTKRIAVYCPAFVADCLETLEEIGIGLKEAFIEAGGDELVLVPSLNSDQVWIDAVVGMLRDVLGQPKALPRALEA